MMTLTLTLNWNICAHSLTALLTNGRATLLTLFADSSISLSYSSTSMAQKITAGSSTADSISSSTLIPKSGTRIPLPSKTETALSTLTGTTGSLTTSCGFSKNSLMSALTMTTGTSSLLSKDTATITKGSDSKLPVCSHNIKKQRSIPQFVLDNLDSLQILRNVMHWTQSFVAREIHISQQTYSGYELRHYIPPKDIYNRLAKLFEWEAWE